MADDDALLADNLHSELLKELLSPSKTSENVINIALEDMEDYIIDNINDMTKKDRNEFLNIIKQSHLVDIAHLREKGNGIQVFFNNIPSHLIQILYNFVKRKLDNERNM